MRKEFSTPRRERAFKRTTNEEFRHARKVHVELDVVKFNFTSDCSCERRERSGKPEDVDTKSLQIALCFQ